MEQEDVLNMFEGMAKHLFKVIRGVEFKESFMRMTWQDAMKQYGSDKPDLVFRHEVCGVDGYHERSWFSPYSITLLT